MNRLLQRIRHADGRMQRILGEKKQKSLRLTWALRREFYIGNGQDGVGDTLLFAFYLCERVLYIQHDAGQALVRFSVWINQNVGSLHIIASPR